MTGVEFWAIIGPAVAGFGVALGDRGACGVDRLSACTPDPAPRTLIEGGRPVARVVVDVMPKPEILDPQGKAVQGALPRLGFTGVSEVRQGKRFELELEGEATEERLAEVHQMAATLLSNPVIEDYAVAVVAVTCMKVGRRHLPRFPRRRRRASRRTPRPGPSRSRCGTATTTSRGSTRWCCRGLLLRRLPALRRDRPVRAGDDRGDRCGQGRPAGPRHLQRLPDPVRVPPVARRPDPQRPPQVRLPRPADHASRTTRPPGPPRTPPGQELTIVLKNGEGSYVADQQTLDMLEAEGRVRRPLRRRQPQRLAARHRRRDQRGGQRRRPDAAPRARRRGPLRSRHRRPRVLHQRRASLQSA